MNLIDWLISRHEYAAVWGHYLAPAGFLAAWIGRFKSIPSTVSIRGNDLDRDMFPTGDFARLLWTLQHAHCITAVTRELAAKVSALCGRNDVVCLRNAVDHEIFRPVPPDVLLREKLGIRADEVVLGFAGELREKKGQQQLLQALRRVRENRPACLLIIGEVRPSEIMKVMQWIGPGTMEENRVRVTGQLASPEEVNRHLQLCDVYLQPSLWDGMPNALLEAMAAGCGCIGSDAGGIPEIITPGVDGIVVPRWQLHRLGDAALEWLDADPEHRMKVRRAARDRVVADFTFDRERRQLQSIIERLIPSFS
jgi:glycosyltransferase involved in cell wall biosynthesis